MTRVLAESSQSCSPMPFCVRLQPGGRTHVGLPLARSNTAVVKGQDDTTKGLRQRGSGWV